jgi:branched-chain amino acid transport system permease protein
MLQLIISGVAMGSIYALVALGFVMLYNATGVINFAQGELVALGAYLCVFAIAAFGLPPLLSLGIALLAMLVLAPILFLLAYYPLRDRSLLVGVVGTVGIGIALKNLLLLIAGPLPRTLPPFFGGGQIEFGGVSLPVQNVAIVVVALAMFAAYFLYTHFTFTGIMLRATAQDRDMARMVGIRVNRMIGLTFVASCIIATVAGYLVAPVVFVSPDMGLPLMLKAFIAIVIGGFGSIPGAIAGGMFVGVMDVLISAHVSSTYRDVFTFLAFILVITLRPTGFFGERTAARV